MTEENDINGNFFFEAIIKRTKTGITFPRDLRDSLFKEGKDTYFRIIVPNEKDKIILEILNEEEIESISEKLKVKKAAVKAKKSPEKITKFEKEGKLTPNWGEYFVYDFKNQSKVKPILESAFYKFSETPINLEDAMGRVKYALVSFLESTKTENAKLYFSVARFLIDIIEKFNQPNLLDWIFEKIIPNIDSKFLYELVLLDLVESSLKVKRWEKAELYIFYVLKNIDEYPSSEMYNVMNSFKQLVKKVKDVERSKKIDLLLKEKLMEYAESIIKEDVDYKIQIIEFLEDLQYIELAYKLAKELQKGLPPESVRNDEVRKLVKRLYITPISENKPQSSIDFDERDEEEKKDIE
ncbi:MAG: hypothetical protein ACFFAK_04100 [Promethearchaeota archaeon]